MSVKEFGHRKLLIYKKSHKLAIDIHNMTKILPYFEMHEEGRQIRKSSKSVSNNIVEGYALRRYKNEYIRYFYRAYASSEETLEHLLILKETNSLIDEKICDILLIGYIELNKMLFEYIKTLERNYKSPNYINNPDLNIDKSKNKTP